MSAPVDVLAVMADAASVIAADIDYGEHSLGHYQAAVRLPEAREAVAALIEAAEWVVANPTYEAYWPDLRAALARCNGGAK